MLKRNLKSFGRDYQLMAIEREWGAGPGLCLRLTELVSPDKENQRFWAIWSGEFYRDATAEEVLELDEALADDVYVQAVRRIVLARIENECGEKYFDYSSKAVSFFDEMTDAMLRKYAPIESDTFAALISAIKLLRREHQLPLHVSKIIVETLQENEK